MINIGVAFQSERTIKAVIGVSIEEFNKLLPTFAEELEKERLSTASLPTSYRAPGAGRKHTLHGAKEKLFYILYYLKCYPTYDLAGLCFDVDRSQACRWVEELLPILRKVLAREQVLPLRGGLSEEEYSYLFQGLTDLYMDGTERPVQRPVEHEHQKACYSGKKKRHTRKNLILNDERKRVLILIGTC
ncbi:MAG: IS5/IS1182 family transposase, partial [Planctomycetes bacterium]|nr:IS5/IS1182 family transposase [Planctomycetota bacterium]